MLSFKKLLSYFVNPTKYIRVVKSTFELKKMGEKIVPLEMNLVRYSNPISVTEREDKLRDKVCKNFDSTSCKYN